MTDKELPAPAEAVRRLLAEARHDEPMPDSVARNLDEVIAGLAAERAADEGAADASVIPFRRRRWPKVLVAAAAVSAIGLGITQTIDGVGTGGDDSGGTAALIDDGAAEREADRDELAGDTASSSDAPAAGEAPLAGGSDGRERSAWKHPYLGDGVPLPALTMLAGQLDSTNRGSLRPLDRTRLSASLKRLAGELVAQRANLVQSNDALGTRGATYDAPIAPRNCGPIYTVVGGRATYATYREQLALVLFHPEINGAQLVELYVCSGRTPRRTVERVTLWDGE